MLEVREIYKTFNAGTVNEKRAINGVSLTLADGDFVTVIGGNGAGKSTLLNLVAGVYGVDGGSILIDGNDVTRLPEYRRAQYIGRVFQDPMMGTAASMQIEENLALAARRGQTRTLRAGITKAEREQYRELLKILDLGLEDRLTSKVGLLSGGQRQRVALGRAIVREPKVFLMDEPLSNLDAKLRVQMRTEITKLHQRLQTTFIYVTHDQTEAMTMASRIVVMKDGVVQQVDTPQNLYDFPANEFVAGFIGSPQMNFFDVRLKRENNEVVAYFGDNKIVVPQGKVSKFVDESYVGREVVMGIRPENIHDDEMFLANAADATIDVKVEVTEKMGSETYLYLTTTGKEGNIIARVNPRTTSTAGGEIKVAFDVNHLHFFDKETARTILVSDAVPAPTKTNLTK